ncbi:hypothetical protein GH714_005481 [Hevea brasiliensis]|uniref:Uncharacterized protein n=1 Tax=Hevea brasiliensis TaxID=3981 RepID=A0A6A6KDI5_HEVBR|nr:hypothetical protein GH714_005481 [Hevea brasiliensis]
MAPSRKKRVTAGGQHPSQGQHGCTPTNSSLSRTISNPPNRSNVIGNESTPSNSLLPNTISNPSITSNVIDNVSTTPNESTMLNHLSNKKRGRGIARGFEELLEEDLEKDLNENIEANLDENSEQMYEDPIELKLYFDTHHKKDGTWTHPQAQENYEQMKALCKQAIDEGTEISGRQILEKVLKSKSVMLVDLVMG